MAELVVVADKNTKKLSAAVSEFKTRGHVVNTVEFHEEILALQGRGRKPDLLLVDRKTKDARRIFDNIQRRAGGFPAVIPSKDSDPEAGGRGPGLAAEAFYMPMECNLEGTFGLIRSVLSIWHDN